MSKAIVNPEELRRFANDLKRFSEETRHQMSIMQGRFASLGQTFLQLCHQRGSIRVLRGNRRYTTGRDSEDRDDHKTGETVLAVLGDAAPATARTI